MSIKSWLRSLLDPLSTAYWRRVERKAQDRLTPSELSLIREGRKRGLVLPQEPYWDSCPHPPRNWDVELNPGLSLFDLLGLDIPQTIEDASAPVADSPISRHVESE